MAKKVEKKVKKPIKTPAKVAKVEPKKIAKPEPKKVSKPEPKKEEKKIVAKPEVKPAPKKEPVVKKKVRKKVIPEKKFEEKKDLDRLYVYISIVNSGVADNIVKLFEDMGSSVSFIQNGLGTATEEVRNALHIKDNKKEVVYSIIRASRLEAVEQEINAFFMASRRNKGVAFAIPMDSIQGVRLYKFLSQTL